MHASLKDWNDDYVYIKCKIVPLGYFRYQFLMKISLSLACAASFAAGFLAYANTLLGHEYVFDDHLAILNNADVSEDLSYRIWLNDFLGKITPRSFLAQELQTTDNTIVPL